MSFVISILSYITFNVVIKQWSKWIVASILVRVSSFVVLVIGLWDIIETSISHVNISHISFTIYFFMDNIIARKTIAKKYMFIPTCKWSCWCHVFSKLIPFAEGRKFLSGIIHFHAMILIHDGVFKSSCISLWLFLKILYYGVRDFIRGLLILIVSNSNLNKRWFFTIENVFHNFGTFQNFNWLVNFYSFFIKSTNSTSSFSQFHPFL